VTAINRKRDPRPGAITELYDRLERTASQGPGMPSMRGDRHPGPGRGRISFFDPCTTCSRSEMARVPPGGPFPGRNSQGTGRGDTGVFLAPVQAGPGRRKTNIRDAAGSGAPEIAAPEPGRSRGGPRPAAAPTSYQADLVRRGPFPQPRASTGPGGRNWRDAAGAKPQSSAVGACPSGPQVISGDGRRVGKTENRQPSTFHLHRGTSTTIVWWIRARTSRPGSGDGPGSDLGEAAGFAAGHVRAARGPGPSRAVLEAPGIGGPAELVCWSTDKTWRRPLDLPAVPAERAGRGGPTVIHHLAPCRPGPGYIDADSIEVLSFTEGRGHQAFLRRRVAALAMDRTLPREGRRAAQSRGWGGLAAALGPPAPSPSSQRGRPT